MKFTFETVLAIVCVCLFADTCKAGEGSSIAPPLSPAESIATMEIQPGYKLSPVLTEPHIAEPSAIAWDGNGRMYVVEMRSCMQDIDGTIVYGQIDLPGEQSDGFRDVFPIDNVPDVQGGLSRVREDNTLNVFTGVCGQSIYRGDRLPSEFAGDLILCEPVGRLIRRVNVSDENGRITLSNAYDKAEFIAARDPNFRPINSATGPDGCLYLVDMYRGIIQEGRSPLND